MNKLKYVRIQNEDGSYGEKIPFYVDGSTVEINGQSLATKINEINSSLANKVIKEQGKGLSSNDYTNEEKQKLSNVEAGATNTIIDSTLNIEGAAADALAVKEKINTEKNALQQAINLQANHFDAEITQLQSLVGSPLTASTVSEMTDHDKIYVYTGSESGYVNGNWYYWNGSTWASGGVYNSVAINIDSTPTQGSTNAASSGAVYDIKEDNALNFASIFDAHFTQSALTVSKTIESRGLSNSGAVAYDTEKTLRYYPVTAGDLLYLNLSANTGTTTAVWEFTSSDTSISNYIVGSVHFDAIDGMVRVPTGATYIIVAQDASNTSFVVDEVVAKDYDTAIDNVSKTIRGFVDRKYFTQLSWEQGWYNASGTHGSVDTHRFCTTNYIPIDSNKEQYVQDTLPGYTISIVYFDANYGWEKTAAVNSDNRIYIVDSSYAYYKIQYYNASADINDAKNISTFMYVMNTGAENSIIGRNADKDVLITNVSIPRPTQFADTYKPLEFLHFSDVHRQKQEWRNVCIYMDEHVDYIPFAIHTGDYCLSYQGQYTDLYAVRSPENGGYILNCVGNHDVYSNSSGTERGTQAETYALLFNHTSDWGVTFGTGDNIMYYYKDFAESGIRLIVLDIYYWDDTEKAWFDDLLADAITNDLQVITATHIATKKLPVANRVDCTFNVLDELGSASTGESDMVSAIEDSLLTFISNGGVHICNLCGHYHHDVIGYSQNNILNIAVECATHGGAGWNDALRAEGTKAFDAFNVVAVDRVTSTIRIVRIGNNSDCYGRGKNVLCYDYTNKAVIANY